MSRKTLRKTFTFEGRRYEVTGSTQAELYERMAQKKLELKEGVKQQSTILTKEYVAEWYRVFKEPYVGAKTREMYTTQTNHIIRYIGNLQLKAVTSTDIQKMITEELNKGRSKSHLDKLIMTINQVFEQACKDKKIRDNPAENIAVPKIKPGKGRAVTDEERKYILEVAENHRYGRWIRGIMYLGFRPDETSLIQGKDIDVANRTLHIRGTKTDKADRYVPIPEFLIDEYTGFADEEYVYATSAGNPPNKQRRHRWWSAFKRDLDIAMGAKVYRNKIVESVVAEDLIPYCLRHTYGTDGQAAGIPIDVLADLMGHEDIATTRKYYIHENTESREAARMAFEKLYNDKKVTAR